MTPPPLAYDTSVWVEYFKRTESRADLHLTEHLEAGGEVVVPEVVRMELLQFPTDELALRRRVRLLDTMTTAPIEPLVDCDVASALQRACRAAGRPVRTMLDCLVAAQTMRLGVPLAHRDRDFVVLAQVAGVPTVDLTG